MLHAAFGLVNDGSGVSGPRAGHPRAARWAIALALASPAACGGSGAPTGPAAPGAGSAAARVDRAADAYVRLALALDARDPGYLDAYYGPAAWREQASDTSPSLAEIRQQASALASELRAVAASAVPADRRPRRLLRQVEALASRADLLGGATLSFDEESRALYDAVAPPVAEKSLRPTLDALARRLPGRGPLVERYQALKARFLVPPDRLDRVLTHALAACRDRTARQLRLPAGERVTIEYVGGQPWNAYARYRGGLHTVVQVNTDIPVPIDRALEVACHEGYPGHHVASILQDEELVRRRGWIEFAVQPLFSPRAFVAEGTASLGAEIAFPGEARARFEREELFPLAGLDPRGAEEYAEVERLVRGLAPAIIEGARRYVDGRLDAAQAANWLEAHAVLPSPFSTIAFVNRYRSYVINYSLGQALVRAALETRAGAPDRPERRWAEFVRLLLEPPLPSELDTMQP